MLLRIIIGIIFYEIGLFFASLVFLATIISTLLKGREGIAKLFRKQRHDVQPEIATKGYDHDYVRIKSGTRFHYVHAGNESKPLMLCLHGFPECWYSWKHVLKQFSSDYHVVAVDTRGYGDSDKPDGVSNYHLTYLVNDVKEIIRALGHEKAVLVSHDWGSVIAWQVPLYFPEVVEKLIVMNVPHAAAMRDYMMSHPWALLKFWYMFFFQIPFLPEWLIGINDYQQSVDTYRGRGPISLNNPDNYMTDDEIEIYKCNALQPVHYGINYYRACNPLYSGLKLKRVSKMVNQPTLIIWGTGDFIVDTRMIPYCKKYCTNMKSVLVPGASHFVQLDEPEKVAQAMKEFLAEN